MGTREGQVKTNTYLCFLDFLFCLIFCLFILVCFYLLLMHLVFLFLCNRDVLQVKTVDFNKAFDNIPHQWLL